MHPDFLMYFLIVLISSVMFIRRVIKLFSPSSKELNAHHFIVRDLTKTVQDTERFTRLVKEFAPHSPNAEKRRQKLIALYNECLTYQQYHLLSHPFAVKLAQLFDRVMTNPRKYFNLVVLSVLLADFSPQFAFAQTSADLLQRANDAYDNGRYQEAIDILQTLHRRDEHFKKAVVCYKIAIAYQKLKNCDSATVYFRAAYWADTQKGGASSLEKFREKLQSCGISISQLSSNQDVILSSKKEIEQLIQAGNDYYERKEYVKALDEYLKALQADSTFSMASLYYKIAITHQKLKNCELARLYFRKAYQKDPEKGGASSLDKFVEKINDCQLRLSDLQDRAESTVPAVASPEEEDWLENILMGLIIGFLVGVLGREILITPIVSIVWFNDQRLKLYIQQTVLDPYFWKGLSEKYPPHKVKHLKRLFESIAKNVFEDNRTASLKTLKYHVDWLKKDPPRYLSDQKNTYLYFLRGMLPIDFYYCFFTATELVSGKTSVVAVVHPNGRVQKVWAAPKLVRQLHQNPSATIKVRVHKKENVFVHWSEDETFFQFLDTANLNRQRMEKWQGEVRNVPLQKFHEIFTNFPLNYIPPHPEAIADAVIHYIPPVEAPKTGFEPKEESILDDSSSLSDVMTNVMMADLISSALKEKDDDMPLRDLS